MPIIDDYAAVSAEVRRIRAEQSPQKAPAEAERTEPALQHRMRTTIADHLLYQRLVPRQVQRQRGLRPNSDRAGTVG